MIRKEKQDEIKETKTTVFWDTIIKEKINPEDSNSVENYIEKTIIKEAPESKEIKKEDRPIQDTRPKSIPLQKHTLNSLNLDFA